MTHCPSLSPPQRLMARHRRRPRPPHDGLSRHVPAARSLHGSRLSRSPAGYDRAEEFDVELETSLEVTEELRPASRRLNGEGAPVPVLRARRLGYRDPGRRAIGVGLEVERYGLERVTRRVPVKSRCCRVARRLSRADAPAHPHGRTPMPPLRPQPDPQTLDRGRTTRPQRHPTLRGSPVTRRVRARAYSAHVIRRLDLPGGHTTSRQPGRRAGPLDANRQY